MLTAEGLWETIRSVQSDLDGTTERVSKVEKTAEGITESVSYKCECGHCETADIREFKGAKLGWRVVSVSSPPADEESSQAERAKPSTPARAQTVNIFANVFFIAKPFGIYSESLRQRTEYPWFL